MKIAILSDIHGNLEAFEAVLSDLEVQCPDKVVSLGDLVGYGPDPEAIVRRMRELDVVSLLGNHESALVSIEDRDWMNFQAKENNIVTKSLLSKQSLEYCAALARSATIENALFVHGCPPDLVLKYLYMLTDDDIRALVQKYAHSLFFMGHTHELKLVTVSDDAIGWERLHEGLIMLDKDKKYLVNVGSVGQPRDGNNKAKYVIWDSVYATLEVRALFYPADVTAEKIIARGFPKAYATRLL